MFGDQIAGYKEILEYNGEYVITDALITPMDQRYKGTPDEMDFQMMFGNQTVVKPLRDNKGPILPEYLCIEQIPRAVGHGNRFGN